VKYYEKISERGIDDEEINAYGESALDELRR